MGQSLNLYSVVLKTLEGVLLYRAVCFGENTLVGLSRPVVVAFVLCKDQSPPGSRFKAVSSASRFGRNTRAHQTYVFFFFSS